MPDEYLDAVGNILLHIVDVAVAEWEECTTDLYSFLAAKAFPRRPEQIERELKQWREEGRILINSRNPVYLPPLKEEAEFVALLLMDWTFAERNDFGSQRSIRLQMFRRRTGVDTFDGRLNTFCVHLDGPNKAPWNFYHMQVCNRETPGFEDTYHESPEWLPRNLPRIPVSAINPAELLFCLVVGLYGIQHTLVMILQERTRPDLTSILRRVALRLA